MLACDFLMHVRASRAISGDQYSQLERLVFDGGGPSQEQLDILFIINSYLKRPDPRWADLMTRAALAVLAPPASAAEPIAKAA